MLPAIQQNQAQAPTCQYLGPRLKIQAWEQLGANKVLLHVLRHGVKAPLRQTPPQNHPRPQFSPSLEATIVEYLETAAIRELTQVELNRTRHWTPIFPREKKDSHKVRMITDLQQLNQCHDVKKHRAETWKNIMQVVKNKDLQWALTLDLKGYYHHIAVHAATQR